MRLVRLAGVAYDAGGTFAPGPAAAPAAIRARLFSPAGNLWTEAGQDLDSPGRLVDAGDVDLSATSPLERIRQWATELWRQPGRPLFLGGDHAITLPLVQAAAAVHGPLTILHVDAHPDLYDTIDGRRHSHANPFARLLEAGAVTRLVQVGIRASNAHLREQAQRFGVETLDMAAWRSGHRPQVAGPVYVSLDLDALDPAFCPGVNHPEAGGLTTSEVVGLIQALPGPLLGADLVEYCPGLDPAGQGLAAAAKLVKELAGAMLRE